MPEFPLNRTGWFGGPKGYKLQTIKHALYTSTDIDGLRYVRQYTSCALDDFLK